MLVIVNRWRHLCNHVSSLIENPFLQGDGMSGALVHSRIGFVLQHSHLFSLHINVGVDATNRWRMCCAKVFPCKMVRMVLENSASWSLNKKQKGFNRFLTLKITFKIRIVQSSHVSHQFQLNGSLRQSAGLLKYVAYLKLSDLFETSNCNMLLWRHLMA